MLKISEKPLCHDSKLRKFRESYKNARFAVGCIWEVLGAQLPDVTSSAAGPVVLTGQTTDACPTSPHASKFFTITQSQMHASSTLITESGPVLSLP